MDRLSCQEGSALEVDLLIHLREGPLSFYTWQDELVSALLIGPLPTPEGRARPLSFLVFPMVSARSSRHHLSAQSILAVSSL